jgi:hypothetical protein
VVRFTLKNAGTFHYWASTGAPSLESRFAEDAQLGGALIADRPGAAVDDRVFVLGLQRDKLEVQRKDLTVINGRSWPHTERLKYATGDTARWRVVNLTLDPHAMHLHGFFFTVHGIGDGITDTQYSAADARKAVTEQLPPGSIMTMTWVPERAGEWLFHCHMLVHMMPPGHEAHAAVTADAPAAGMSGLVLGVSVTGPDRDDPVPDRSRRQLQLAIDHDTRHEPAPSYTLALTSAGSAAARLNERSAPGPVMVLTRGEPVAVEIVNRLRQPTAIHWHGIELELAAGVPHRLRLINITANNVAITVQLVQRFDPAHWTLISKDGATTPDSQRTPRPARQIVSVGETYDFELAPMRPAPVELWLELRRGNGELLKQWPVRVK